MGHSNFTLDDLRDDEAFSRTTLESYGLSKSQIQKVQNVMAIEKGILAEDDVDLDYDEGGFPDSSSNVASSDRRVSGSLLTTGNTTAAMSNPIHAGI